MFAGLTLGRGAAAAFVQVVMIDLVLAGDNAVAVGMVAAGVDPARRRKVIVAGLSAAVVMLIGFALIATQMLRLVGLLFAGGVLLMWVCWKMWRDLRAEGRAGDAAAEAALEDHGGGASATPKSFRDAFFQILLADLAMSLDNVLAVAGAARDYPVVLIGGLLLSITLMGVAATWIARLLQTQRWIGYAGLVIVIYVAVHMIWTGHRDLVIDLGKTQAYNAAVAFAPITAAEVDTRHREHGAPATPMSADSPAPAPTPPADPVVMRLALIVAAAFFMENLDGTVIVTALPKIGMSFGVAATDLSLSITAYLLTLAAFIPVSPWASDRFGSRTVFVGAVALFTFASVLCGLAVNMPTFIAARILQGFAAALMAPVGRLVVLRTTPKNQLVRAMATLTWPALIAPVLGPPIGGFITTYADWRWIFFLNVPIGIVGVALALRFVPQEKGAAKKAFDRLGFVLTATALGSFIYGLDLLSRRDANPPLATALVAIGLLLGAAAIRHSRRTTAPLLDFSGLKAPSFALSSVTSGTLARLSISATPFLLPLMFQIAFGLTPARAGLLVLVYMAGNLVMKTVTTPILRWFGFRRVLVINGLLSAVAIGACGLLSPHTAAPLLYAALFAAGAFRSMNFTAMNTLAFAEITPEGRGGATALWGMVQQVAFSLGVAAAAVALNLSLALRKGQGLEAADFRLAFAAMAGVALVSALWFARLEPGVGAEVSGHRRKPVNG